jgi:plasmid stabilization system protein ParE
MSDTEDKDEPTQTYALRFTERARRDLDAATVYLAETASPEIAVAWREGVYETLSSLATFPRSCPLVPEKFRLETRQILYRRPGSQAAYRILFTITGEQAQSPDPPTVTVLHVRHASAHPITRTQVREIESGE